MERSGDEGVAGAGPVDDGHLHDLEPAVLLGGGQVDAVDLVGGDDDRHVEGLSEGAAHRHPVARDSEDPRPVGARTEDDARLAGDGLEHPARRVGVPQQRTVVDVESDVDAPLCGLVDEVSDHPGRVLREGRGDPGDEDEPGVQHGLPVEVLDSGVAERGVQAVVDDLGGHGVLAGLHEVERDAASLGAHDVAQVHSHGAELVEHAFAELAFGHDRRPRGAPPQLGEQPGDVGLRAGGRHAQLAGRDQPVPLVAGQADLSLSDGGDVESRHG